MAWISDVEKDTLLKDWRSLCSSGTTSVEESERCLRRLVVRFKANGLNSELVAQLPLLAVTSEASRRTNVLPRGWYSNDDIVVDLLVDLETDLYWDDEEH